MIFHCPFGSVFLIRAMWYHVYFIAGDFDPRGLTSQGMMLNILYLGHHGHVQAKTCKYHCVSVIFHVKNIQTLEVSKINFNQNQARTTCL